MRPAQAGAVACSGAELTVNAAQTEPAGPTAAPAPTAPKDKKAVTEPPGTSAPPERPGNLARPAPPVQTVLPAPQNRARPVRTATTDETAARGDDRGGQSAKPVGVR